MSKDFLGGNIAFVYTSPRHLFAYQPLCIDVLSIVIGYMYRHIKTNKINIIILDMLERRDNIGIYIGLNVGHIPLQINFSRKLLSLRLPGLRTPICSKSESA